jgi:hypothetical protein
MILLSVSALVFFFVLIVYVNWKYSAEHEQDWLKCDDDFIWFNMQEGEIDWMIDDITK